MKRRFYIFGLTLLFVLLCGCNESRANQREIQVSILETPGVTVENNGKMILPGQDAVFLLDVEDGLSITGTDYEGTSHIQMKDGKIQLTLEAVSYPVRVTLKPTEHFALLTYHTNMDGESITVPYDTTLHNRPNTANGTLFCREGYTLESWNTCPDGSGQRIGLGSRVSVPDGELQLYAQWQKWSDEAYFRWSVGENGAVLTRYLGSEDTVVIPGTLGGQRVTAIAAGAFQNCEMSAVILPDTLVTVEEGVFDGCSLTTLTLFDNIETVTDAAFRNCPNLQTLRINAVEKPFGTAFRRESCYADKVDMLIEAQGKQKIVFYGGCSIWYNLDGSQLKVLERQGYTPINVGINGMVNSAVQLQILGHFLEPGDILFHTPELSSERQMMLIMAMDAENDDKLWCGLEYNYDLFSLVDLRTVPGALDSFSGYLAKKTAGTEYNSVFMEEGNLFCDPYGCIPFLRETTEDDLPDRVYLAAAYISDQGMKRLQSHYDTFQAKGVRVYLSYACVNMDDVPDDQKANVEMMETRFRKAIAAMNGPTLISRLEDFLFSHNDFYDTNYHLRTETAAANTAIWLRDLQAQMEQDGLWRGK